MMRDLLNQGRYAYDYSSSTCYDLALVQIMNVYATNGSRNPTNGISDVLRSVIIVVQVALFVIDQDDVMVLVIISDNDDDAILISIRKGSNRQVFDSLVDADMDYSQVGVVQNSFINYLDVASFMIYAVNVLTFITFHDAFNPIVNYINFDVHVEIEKI